MQSYDGYFSMIVLDHLFFFLVFFQIIISEIKSTNCKIQPQSRKKSHSMFNNFSNGLQHISRKYIVVIAIAVNGRCYDFAGQTANNCQPILFTVQHKLMIVAQLMQTVNLNCQSLSTVCFFLLSHLFATSNERI